MPIKCWLGFHRWQPASLTTGVKLFRGMYFEVQFNDCEDCNSWRLIYWSGINFKVLAKGKSICRG